MKIVTFLKYVKKILVRNTITGKVSEIDFEELKPDTVTNRKKLEVAGIKYEVKRIY